MLKERGKKGNTSPTKPLLPGQDSRQNQTNVNQVQILKSSNHQKG